MLFICFIHSNIYMLLPDSCFIPHPHHSPLVTMFVFSVCESIYFISKFICITFLASTYKWYHMIFVFVISLRMIISGCIHVAANGIISFFLWPSNTPLYICTASSLSIHLSMDTQVASMTWLLWIVLLWTQGCMYLFEL